MNLLIKLLIPLVAGVVKRLFREWMKEMQKDSSVADRAHELLIKGRDAKTLEETSQISKELWQFVKAPKS